MSHSSGIDMLSGGSGRGGRRAEKPPRGGGRGLGTIIVLALIVVALFFGYQKAKDVFGGPEDYSGAGTGSVVVEIPAGSNGQQIANILAKQDVVKSAEAFYQLSIKDQRAQTIQPGFYSLKKQMSAEAAMKALSD